MRNPETPVLMARNLSYRANGERQKTGQVLETRTGDRYRVMEDGSFRRVILRKTGAQTRAVTIPTFTKAEKKQFKRMRQWHRRAEAQRG